MRGEGRRGRKEREEGVHVQRGGIRKRNDGGDTGGKRREEGEEDEERKEEERRKEKWLCVHARRKQGQVMHTR